MHKKTNKELIAVIFGLALTLAPTAHASEGRNEPSRDTGVGNLIAKQGNEALAMIRAEARAAVRSWAPRLPAPARVLKASQPAGGHLATASVRAAK